METHKLCGGKMTQDPDTLDTWFSSALWTWSTLVDPDVTKDPALSLKQMLAKSPDFQKFHPTNIMETGYDLLFFWVARMILMTTYATGQVPFKTVYFHGLIRTKDGKKMSKSDPSTMIDPLDIIPKYGADALRLSMIVGQSPGADAKLYDEKIAGYRNFINKLWNASRFVLMECEKAGVKPEDVTKSEATSLADKALAQETAALITDVTKGIVDYRLSETGERLYAFTWDFFCDWYLELSKGEPNPQLLVETMRTLLTLLHPYCPFVTEELWAHFKPKNAGMLIKESWPKPAKALYSKERAELQVVIDVVSQIRRIRSEHNVGAGTDITVTIRTDHPELLESQQEHLRRLTKTGSLTFETKPLTLKNVASATLPGIEVYVSLEGLFDPAKEKANLTKEQENLVKFAKGIEAKLGNEQFVAKAPPDVIDEQKAKLAEAKEKLQKIQERVKAL